MDDHPVVGAVAVATALAVAVFTGWATVIAFVGGTVPIVGWELEGGLGSGLFWLFVVDPILVTVGYWLSLVVLVPLMAIASRRRDPPPGG